MDAMETQALPLIFTVPDMMCGSCGKKIVAAVQGLAPEAIVVTNPETKEVQVTTAESWDAVKGAIEAVGFEVTV
jgi:copper chaperone CopZ